MTRLAVGACASLLLLVVSCGGKDKAKPDAATDAPPDGSGTEGGVDTTAPGTCEGTLRTYTRASLGPAIRAGGKCGASSDLDIICPVDPTGQARGSVEACLSTVGSDDAALLASCVDVGLRSRASTLSPDCYDCFADWMSCALQKCLAQCRDDVTGSNCTACQLAQGCSGPFFGCSGLPGGTASDAGVSDSGGGDTSADAAAGG
jgi:hypothetical protein